MPLHQTPSLQIALLFTAYAHDSEVIVLTGYQWLACKQALHMGYSEICFRKARRRTRERRACNGPWMIWVLPPFPLDWSFTSRPHNSAHNYSLKVVQHGNWNKACFWIISALKTSKWSQIILCILTNVLTSISERFCPNFEQINIPLWPVGNQGWFSNMSGLSYLTRVKLNWPISNLCSESECKYSNRTMTIAGSPLSRAPWQVKEALLG